MMTKIELSVREWSLLLKQMQKMENDYPDNYIAKEIVRKLEDNPPRLGTRCNDNVVRSNIMSKDLRYVIRKIPFGYMGECLELGLVVRDKDFNECCNKIQLLAKDYLKTTDMLKREGHKIIHTPVKFYWLRKVKFDIGEFLRVLFD